MSVSIAISMGNVLDARTIKRAVAPLFSIKESHIREALAAAEGFRTTESRIASCNGKFEHVFSHCSYPEFTRRLQELESVPGTAEAISSLIQGASIMIEIVKRPMAAYAKYNCVVYGITIRLTTPEGEPADHSMVLPEFTGQHGEPYRVDNWHNHRHYPASSEKPTYRPLTNVGAFIDGIWRGELFVYGAAHQQCDNSCLKRVRAALARAALRDLAGGIYCDIARPQGYDYGAWRVGVKLGGSATTFSRQSEITFRRPELTNRFFVPDKGYATGELDILRLVSGQCFMHVYSNGIDEDSNATSIAEVRKALIESLAIELERLGWSHSSQ